jgi:hypothetical protein
MVKSNRDFLSKALNAELEDRMSNFESSGGPDAAQRGELEALGILCLKVADEQPLAFNEYSWLVDVCLTQQEAEAEEALFKPRPAAVGDKSYWKEYSAVATEKYILYINSGNEAWGLFKIEPHEGVEFNEDKHLSFLADGEVYISVRDQKPYVNKFANLISTMFSCGVPGSEATQLVSNYMEFLWPAKEEE